MGKGGPYNFKAYLLTNGRSTFKYSRLTLQSQKDEMPIEVVRDKPMAKAMNEIIETTDATHILKVDDDFFLHPYAIMYMKVCVKNHLIKPAMWYWKLWEDYTRRSVQCIKIYDVKKVRDVGGFKANRVGQIDRNFKKTIQKSKYRIWKDDSCVALHACASWEENLKYEEIWSNFSKTKHTKDKVRRRGMKRYKKSVKEQYKTFEKMLNTANTKGKTPFSKWLKGRK